MILPLNPSRRYAAPSPNPKDLGRAGVGSHLGEVPARAEGAISRQSRRGRVNKKSESFNSDLYSKIQSAR